MKRRMFNHFSSYAASFVCAAAFLLALNGASSCSRDLEKRAQSGRQGCLRTRVAMASSAGVNSDLLLDGSVVKIYNGDFTGLIRRYLYKELPSEIMLAEGNYRMDVEAGEIVKEAPNRASWNLKSYKGSKPFEITPGCELSIELTAGICNVVSVVNFDASVDTFLEEGYSFTLGCDLADASKCLIYTATENGCEGYFLPASDESSLFWEFSGKKKADGSSIVRSGRIDDIEKGKSYVMTPKYTNKDGFLGFDLSVVTDVEEFDDIIIFDPVSTGLLPVTKTEVWAGHATVHASVDEAEFTDPSIVKLAYSADGSNWLECPMERVAEGDYKALVKGLKGATEYECKLLVGGVETGDPIKFTTELDKQFPNAGFEVTSNAESADWTSFYDPSSPDVELQTKFWDSGSTASAGMLGAKYAICYSDTDVPEGTGSTKCARLQTINAVVKLAAGNIFTGEYYKTVGTSGGIVNFGRPWNGSRPTALRLWYRYVGGVVDKGCDYISTGKYDLFNIKLAFGNWPASKYKGSPTCPVQVNTTDASTLYEYPDLPETVAYCKIEERGDGNLGPWKQVTVPIEYYSETEYPSFVVFAAAASKYGDYFAGSYSSRLYIDNIELIYE